MLIQSSKTKNSAETGIFVKTLRYDNIVSNEKYATACIPEKEIQNKLPWRNNQYYVTVKLQLKL